MNKLIKHSISYVLVFLLASTGFAQTSIIVKDEVPKGWHLMNKQETGYYGINLNKAYEFLKGKKSTEVIVAVIDSGIDTTHEDLKAVLWNNPKEIPGNNIDDDKNGYVDDLHGWNFLGGKDGRNVKKDSYEAARFFHQYKNKFENVKDPSSLSKVDKELYIMWKKAQKDIIGDEPANVIEDEKAEMRDMQEALRMMKKSDSILKIEMAKEIYTGKELDSFKANTDQGRRAKVAFLYLLKANEMMEMSNKDFLEQFGEYVDSKVQKLESKDKAPEDYRGQIVKDNYNDINDRFYGNNDVMANTPFHGTHVSGIIAATRNNSLGIDGIADNVKIMMLRAVPDGDEHDKDIALAIRYAVDNGAKVINMSFGKGLSPEKNWVDDAVRYASSKGVLLVHAAGNDGANIDTAWNFPSPVFKSDKKRAGNWITVGASGDPKTGGIVANFSNYGKKEVDVFAPGRKIYSTIPGGNTYGDADGTSMASPVVAGVAALILEYFPTLTPEQVKMAIEKSAIKPGIKGMKPHTDEEIEFNALSRTGGLLNAYEAVKLASTMKGGLNKKTEKVQIKSTVKPKKNG